MADQTTAELIAEARGIDADWVLDNSSDDSVEVIRELADALEAAEQRADEAERKLVDMRRLATVYGKGWDAAEQRAEEAVSQRNRAYRQRDEEREAKEGNIRALNRVTEERDRLDEAFDRDLPWRYDEVEAQRNQLAAVVEKVREAIRHGSRMDAHPTRMPTDSVQDSELWWASWHARADEAWRQNLTEAIATAPADALREVKAAAWDEGYSHCFDLEDSEEGVSLNDNPYRAREEQDHG